MGEGMEIFVGVVLLFAIIILFKTVRMVPQGYEWTVERFGQLHPHPEPGPGLHHSVDRTASAARST